MSLITQRHGMLWAANNGSAPTPPTPILPSNTVRCKFSSGVTPTMGDSQTLVDATDNVWDITKNDTNWTGLFYNLGYLLEVVGANTSGVTNMTQMFAYCRNLTSVSLSDTSSVTNMHEMFGECTSLTTVQLSDTSSVTDMEFMFFGCPSLAAVPLLDTSSATTMSYMFNGCTNVESGALALYQQASTQTAPPAYYDDCFANCGSDAPASAPIHAEMQQIPASWGGLGA